MRTKLLLSMLFVTALSFGTVGCTASTQAGKMPDPTAENAAKAIAAAEQAQKMAASVDGEWRDVGPFIDKAKAAEKKGDFAAAIKHANTARDQGELGYEQAVSQQELRLPSYLKNL